MLTLPARVKRFENWDIADVKLRKENVRKSGTNSMEQILQISNYKTIFVK